jgi:tetratricopeptide (TPR) repeat protein
MATKLWHAGSWGIGDEMAGPVHNAALGALLAAALATAGCADLEAAGELQANASLTAEPQAQPKADSTSKLMRLASDIEAKGSLETAIALYEQAAAAPQADASVYTRLGDAYAKLNRHPEAEAAYRAALAKSADYGPALLGLGGALIRAGKAEEGLAVLVRAAPLVNQATAYDRLGVAHMAVLQPREALASFEQAHAMAPDDIDITTNLALAAALSGYYEKATDLAKQLAANDKLKDYHRRNLVLVLGIAGKSEEAKVVAANVLDPANVAELLEQGSKLRKMTSPKARARALASAQ